MEVQPGQMLGAYRIISQVGEGGMAAVYKAYQAAMDRYVAVKVLPSQFAKSAEFMGRFQQEARTIANLEHAHILPVYDYGENEGFTYFVMRYLETGTLKERINSGPLTLAETDKLFTQLAGALGYAHARGVIHRDIKPSNALVDSHGDLFLTDFGIAKLLEGAAHFTASGSLTGTPAYMSPEQARGERLDARSDIYSLGIVLYEMVIGRVPFEAETPLAVVLKHLQDPLPLPSTIKPDLDPAIERVLLKALAKDANDRFATTGEFLAAWKKALSGEAYAEMAATGRAASAPAPSTGRTIARAPTVPSAKADQSTARRALPIILTLIGLAALAIMAVLAVVMVNQQNKAAPTALPAATSSVESTSTPAASLDLTAATPLPVDPRWTSWAAGNTVYSVATTGGLLIGGGPGGLTVWNTADGSIIRRFTTADGLPDATVNVVFVDGDGTLWVGTGGGLAHFDGTVWTTYTTEDGLDSNYVSALARIGDSLVVGTQYSYDGGGLNVFDGFSWTHVPDFPSASPDENPDKLSYNINVIAQSSTGEWLVGTTNGLGTFDGATWTRLSTTDGLPDNDVTALLIGDGVESMIGTNGGAVRFENLSPIEQLRGVRINSMLRALDGDLWFSGGGGLWRFDPGRANWESYAEPTGELPSFTMFGAAMDNDGALYFGSETGGLVQYDGQTFVTWAIPNVPSQAAFGKILAAPDGLLWFVQEYGANIDTFNAADETWAQLFSVPCGCEPMIFDLDGNLWAGEYNNGFWIIGNDFA
ncbi:MAG: protein kinase, partial [Chloroflexota bacterium]